VVEFFEWAIRKPALSRLLFQRLFFSYIFFLADLLYDPIIINKNEKQGAMNGQ